MDPLRQIPLVPMTCRPLCRRSFLAGLAALPLISPALAARASRFPLRLAQVPWGQAQPAEVQAVLESAVGVLTPYFTELPRGPVLVTNHPDGPMVQYQRNAAGELVVL